VKPPLKTSFDQEEVGVSRRPIAREVQKHTPSTYLEGLRENCLSGFGVGC
jgi:hypothetical protein